MIVTYSPDGDQPQRFDFDPGKVRVSAAEAIENRFGGTWEEFRVAVLQGSARARRVLLWHLLKTAHPTLRLEDVDFAAGELVVELDRAELIAFREQVAKTGGITDAERERALAALDAEIVAAGDGEGKARSKKSG